MSFKQFDHTGDVGVEIVAPTLDALFAEAARAFADIVTSPDAIESRLTRRISIDASAIDLLLVDFLSELLFRFDTEGFVPASARVTLTRGPVSCEIKAEVSGELLDPARHPVRVTPKAVTYHALDVSETSQGWRARVVFDV